MVKHMTEINLICLRTSITVIKNDKSLGSLKTAS
jgi:hypothetical protein